MPLSIDTLTYDWVAFTSLATVKGRLGDVVDDTQDTQIQGYINTVSRTMTALLGFHTLLSTRTDVYQQRARRCLLTLDARPVQSVTEVRVATTRANLLPDAAIVDANNYFLDSSIGAIRFLSAPVGAGGLIQVEYLGGMADLPPDVLAVGVRLPDVYPELEDACVMQVIHAHNRARQPGGNVTSIPGASTEYTGSYSLLPHVRSIIGNYRRGMG